MGGTVIGKVNLASALADSDVIELIIKSRRHIGGTVYMMRTKVSAEVRFYADHIFRLVYNTQNSRDWLEDSMFDVKAKAMQRIIAPTIAQFCTSRLGAT